MPLRHEVAVPHTYAMSAPSGNRPLLPRVARPLADEL